MNITKKSTGLLTALLKIEIGPADYNAAVEKQISDYRRKTNIPGFRPGHIPAGLIKKMYGKSILADEVNKLITDSLTNYIRDEKFDILGNPLPNPEKNSAIDFENQESFEFYFDLAMAPEFKIPVDQDLQIENHVIKVDDVVVDKYIEDLRKRYVKSTGAKTAITEPAIGDQAEEPANDPEEQEVESEEQEADPKETEIEPAEMNPDFFNKVYPGLDLQTEEDFREQVRKNATMSFNAETDKLLFTDITNALIKNTELPLPDEFLKRWLLERNEGKYTPEEIEKNYDSFADSMRWQLIENKLIRENGLVVTDDDIRYYIRTYMLRQINMPDMDSDMQKRYESIVDTFMQNKEQVQRIIDLLYNMKLMDYFKSRMIFHVKEVSYDDYLKLAADSHDHEHSHEYDYEHEHDHDHDHIHDHKHDHDHDHQH